VNTNPPGNVINVMTIVCSCNGLRRAACCIAWLV
jgi:hypothetical protein